MGVVDVDFEEGKFGELLLFLAARLGGDLDGGASRVNAALFLVEFTHLRRHQRVVSGCGFHKQSRGPVPHQLRSVLERLIASGAVEVVVEDDLGRPRRRLVARRQADLTRFDAGERQTIEDVLSRLAGLSATQISELLQQEPGWRLTKVGETIPLSAAFLGCPQVSTPTSRRLSHQVAKRYGFATDAAGV